METLIIVGKVILIGNVIATMYLVGRVIRKELDLWEQRRCILNMPVDNVNFNRITDRTRDAAINKKAA